MSLFRSVLLLLMVALPLSAVIAEDDEDYQTPTWKELDVQFPAPPRQENLLPFFVSSASENQFFIDGATLNVGDDGVVRYVMVVLSPQGGRNVTYEGMRCESRERRVYASGRLDGSWSKARKNEWVRIQDAAANRQHAALFLEYFCPFGIIVRDADVARKALVQGIHPDNRR